MKRLTTILLIIVVALASATGYLGYRLATEPTSLETLTGLTADEVATMSALAPVLGCSPEDVPGAVGGEAFIDDLGRAVKIPGHSPVERIVSLHPAATETIFCLGADGKLVAVSNAWSGDAFAPDPVESWITTPEDIDNEIEARVSAGALTALNAFSVEPEAILDLAPDVVFAFGYTLPGYAEAIKDEVPVICFAPTTLEDILQNLVLVGKVVGKEAEAESLLSDIKSDIIDIASMTIDELRPKVFCETGYNGGVWTTGEDSFVSSLIILAGGRDLGTPVPAANANISSEYILDSEPDLILLLDYPWGADAQSVAGRSGWGTIPAVTNGKVYELDTESVDKVTRPGPRIAQGLEVLLGIIHPELSK